MLIITPTISVKPNYFTTYAAYDSTNNRIYDNNKGFEMPTANKSHGIMSFKANKNVRLAIDWLLLIAKDKPLKKKGIATNFNFKVNFITLTLSSKQIHSDNEIKKTMLNQFLTELRQKWNCKNYLWRAETQRNGNIHFHIVSDVFIPWRQLRTDWNRIQEKSGYITRFTKKTGLVDPNSTDIHSINKVKNLSAYLSKYCSKNSKGYVVMATKVSKTFPENICMLTYNHPVLKKNALFFRQVHGKLWGLSQSLSKLKSAVSEITDRVQEEINWLIRKKPAQVKFLDRVSIFSFKPMELLKLKCYAIGNMLGDYYNLITNPPPKPPPPQVEEFNVKLVNWSVIQANLPL